MKKKNYFIKSRLLAVGFALLILATPVIGIATPFVARASAATGSKNDIADRVFSYQAYLMMSGNQIGPYGTGKQECIWTDKDNSIVPTDTTTWMQASSRIAASPLKFNVNEPVGSEFQQSIGADGTQMDCDDARWITKAVGLWGFTNPGDFLEAMKNAGGLKVVDAGFYTTLDSNNHSAEWDSIKTVLQKGYYQGSNLGGLSNDELYYDSAINFAAQCGATFTTSPNAASSNERVTGQTQSYLNGTLTNGYWHYNTADGLFVGTAITGGGTEGKASCADLANNVTKASLIDAYTNYVKAGGTPLDGGNASAGGGQTGGAAATPSINCQSGWNPLNWLFCGIVTGLVAIVNQLDNLIVSQLAVGVPTTNTSQPSLIFGNTQSGIAYKQAWTSFRNIALAIMVIMGLLVIITSMLGFEFLDAYTLRKVIPRFLAAAIFITLSWYIMEFLVVITNEIGYGIRAIIYYPFQNMSGVIDKNLGAGIAVDLLAAGAITALGIVGLLSFAATAALGVFIAFLVLVIRQILIIALILVAPIAIVMYIWPNTKRIYDLWWDSFFKALLMFPIIIAMITVGHVFALVILSQGDSAINSLIAFAAYFAPYFLLPAAFKFAGGALSRIGGFVNDRGRGGFDRLRNFRGHRMQSNMERIRAGNRFEGATDNNLRGRINRSLQAGSNVGRLRTNPRRWGATLGAAASQIGEQQRDKMLEDPDYVWKNDDDLNRAAAETDSAASLRTYLQSNYAARYAGPGGQDNLNRDVERVEQMRRKYGPNSMRQASFIQAVAGGTSYTGVADVWQAAGAVAGGDNAVLATLVAKGRSAAMGAGRVDQGGGGFGDTFAVAQSLRDGTMTIDQAEEHMRGNVYDSQGAATLVHASMKPRAVENMVPEIQRRLSTAQSAVVDARRIADPEARTAAVNDAQEVLDRELANFAGLYDAMAQTSPNKAKILADNVLLWSPGEALPPGSVGPEEATVQGLLTQRRDSTVFTSTRREFSAEQAAAQRANFPLPGGPAGSGPPVTPPTTPPTTPF